MSGRSRNRNRGDVRVTRERQYLNKKAREDLGGGRRKEYDPKLQ